MSAVEQLVADGLQYQLAQRWPEAERSFRAALAIDSTHVEAWSRFGSICLLQGRFKEAEENLSAALQLDPNHVDTICNFGMLRDKQGCTDEAVANYRRALALNPGFGPAHNNLGVALNRLGRFEEGAYHLQQAIGFDSSRPKAHNNLGVALQELAQYERALECYNRAIELDSNYAEPHVNRSLLRLRNGDFSGGWPDYEWRWRLEDVTPRPFKQPQWDGTSLPNGTILLHAEQGLGDTILSIRYAPAVKERVGRVIVECQPPLLPLLKSCPGIDQLFARGHELPMFDTHIPLLSLPRIFSPDLDTIPTTVPYVFVEPLLIGAWHARIGSDSGLNVGIAWRGASSQRSVPLAQFAPLATLQGVRLYSLQKGSGTEQIATLPQPFPLIDFGNELDEATGPFMDTAALMKCLDLIITADTSIPHLAGALGVPVWIALPFVPDWRWLRDRADSPWYPTMRLFRQKQPGDWGGVFEEIASALQTLSEHRQNKSQELHATG